MLYPLFPCTTQPLIDMNNITLKDINVHGSVLTPGIMRCNETNPCHGFVFENVHMDAWYTDKGDKFGWITENVYGKSINSYPNPHFLNEEDYDKEMLSFDREEGQNRIEKLMGMIKTKKMTEVKRFMDK